jgi:hypothetical protein
MSDERIKSYEEFWPFYVREHSKKTTRVLHFAGTTAALTCLGYAIMKRRPALIPLALVFGYGPAWIGHFFVEKNRPATFKYPLWSFLSDFKMLGKMIAGTMDAEVEQAMRAASTNGASHSPTSEAAGAQTSLN